MRLKNRWHAVGILRDITGRTRAVEALKNAHEEAQTMVRELQERVDELERFRKATVQREFRMKELKDEIERLRGTVVKGESRRKVGDTSEAPGCQTMTRWRIR